VKCKLVLLVLIFNLIPLIPVGSEVGDWVIDGNRVYVDDSNVYLEASPHTLGSSGWVNFTLISKTYSGLVDVLWGFDTEVVKPKAAQRWTNCSHRLYNLVWSDTLTRQLEFSNVTDFEEVTKQEFLAQNETLGNGENSKFYRVTYLTYDLDYENFAERTVYVGFYNHYTAYGVHYVTQFYSDYYKEYYDSWFYDWQDWMPDTKVIREHYAGMNKWHLLQDVNVTAGKEYRIRVWMDIPFNPNGTSGKYCWALKPSHMTLWQAVVADCFYMIDPWWNVLWETAYKLTFDNSWCGSNLQNFPVMVHLNSSRIDWTAVQDDLDDLRFIDSDNVTELKYEIENYTTNSEAWIHVKIPQIDASSNTDHIFMYCNNTGASSGEDGANVWDADYEGVWHCSEATGATVDDSTSNNNDGTYEVDDPTQVSNLVDGSLEFDRVDTKINVYTTGELVSSKNITVEVYLSIGTIGDGGDTYHTIYGQRDIDTGRYSHFFSVVESDGKMLYDNYEPSGGSLKSNTALNNDTTYYLAFTRSDDTVTFYRDGVSDGGGTGDVSAPTNAIDDTYFGGMHPAGGANHFVINGTIGEIRVSTKPRSADWINATYLTLTDSYITYSSSEYNPREYDLYIHVTDEDSTDLQNATVTLYDSADAFYLFDYTNSTGYVVKTAADADNYTMIVSLEDYETHTEIFEFDNTEDLTVSVELAEQGKKGFTFAAAFIALIIFVPLLLLRKG